MLEIQYKRLPKNFIFLRRFTKFFYIYIEKSWLIYIYMHIHIMHSSISMVSIFNGSTPAGAEFFEVYVSIVARSYRYSESLRFPMILVGS